MNNLREALRDIVFKCAGGIDDMGDTEVDAILATVSKHLPEKYVTDGSTWNVSPDYHRGHNAAITEMEKLLGGVYES